MPSSMYQLWRCSSQCSNHCWASSGGTKNSISICSNSRVRKMKFPGVISLRKILPIWAIPNGGFLRENCRYVLEVEEDSLGGLGAQVDGRAGVLHGADRRLEHEVELARLGEVAVRCLTGMLRRLAPAPGLLEVVGAEAQLAGPAVDQRVGEAGQVTAGLPRPRVLDDRRVERDDVVALLEHRPPPLAFDVVLEQHAVVAVVVARPEAAIDLAAGEDEARAACTARRSSPWSPARPRRRMLDQSASRIRASGFASPEGAWHSRVESASRAGVSPGSLAILDRDADLRVPLQEGSPVRGHAAHDR